MKKMFLIYALGTAAALPAAAQEWIAGAGYSEFSRPGADHGAVFAAAYHHRPFYERGIFSARFAGVLEVQDSGDAFAGLGAAGTWRLRRGWFIEASVLPGAYAENVDLNDLGSTFEIRTLLGIGKRLANGTGLSLALAHKSNASTAAVNPGVNSVLLRWHIPVGG